MMKSHTSKKQLREFGFLLGFVIPIIMGWILPTINGHNFSYWTLWIGIISLLVSIFQPRLLFYPYKGWISLGSVLGWINSRIILGLVFIFLVQPIAFIMRAFGYDPLRIKKINKKTYREEKKDYSIDLTRIF